MRGQDRPPGGLLGRRRAGERAAELGPARSRRPPPRAGPTPHALSPDNVSLGALPELQRLLRAANRAGRIRGEFPHTPLWITEFGWDSRPPDPGGLPLRLVARWTAEAMYRACKAGASRFYWYLPRDEPRRNQSLAQTIQQGLYLRRATVREDRPKKILIQPFASRSSPWTDRAASSTGARTPSSSGGPVRLEAWSGKRWRRVATVAADGSGIFSGTLRTRGGGGGGGLVRAVYRSKQSVPFSLHYVKDFNHTIFG